MTKLLKNATIENNTLKFPSFQSTFRNGHAFEINQFGSKS